jgi:hypothetical protein
MRQNVNQIKSHFYSTFSFSKVANQAIIKSYPAAVPLGTPPVASMTPAAPPQQQQQQQQEYPSAPTALPQQFQQQHPPM